MKKPVYLGFSILKLSKIIMYKFWFDYVKLKYGEKAKLCYMDTDSFIAYIKTDEICELECNSNDRPLPKGKNKKVIGLMKDELGGKIMTKFVGTRAKMCGYLLDDGGEDKKAKGTKACIIKKPLNLKIIKAF